MRSKVILEIDSEMIPSKKIKKQYNRIKFFEMKLVNS